MLTGAEICLASFLKDIKGDMSFIPRLKWSKKARNHEGIHAGANPFFRLYNQNYEYLSVSKNKWIIREMASIRKMRSVVSMHEIVKVPRRTNFRKSPQNVTKITNVWVPKKVEDLRMAYAERKN